MTIKFTALNFIKQPKTLTPLLFIGMGGYQTVKHYKNAKKEDKTKVIVRDLSILSASLGGILAFQKITSKILNLNTLNNLLDKATTRFKKIKTPAFLAKFFKLEKIEKSKPTVNKVGNFTKNRLIDLKDILKTSILEFNENLGGIIGGLTASYFVGKMGFNPKESANNKKQPQNSPNYNLKNNPDNTAESAVRVAKTLGLNTLQSVNLPISSIDAYSITQEEGIENKFKKASYELIANTAIPSLFLATTVKATQNLNNYAKWGFRGLSILAGLFLGHHAAMYFDKEVTQEIKEDLVKDTNGKPLTFQDIKKGIIKEWSD